jgi:hypothetical protein
MRFTNQYYVFTLLEQYRVYHVCGFIILRIRDVTWQNLHLESSHLDGGDSRVPNCGSYVASVKQGIKI